MTRCDLRAARGKGDTYLSFTQHKPTAVRGVWLCSMSAAACMVPHVAQTRRQTPRDAPRSPRRPADGRDAQFSRETRLRGIRAVVHQPVSTVRPDRHNAGARTNNLRAQGAGSVGSTARAAHPEPTRSRYIVSNQKTVASGASPYALARQNPASAAAPSNWRQSWCILPKHLSRWHAMLVARRTLMLDSRRSS